SIPETPEKEKSPDNLVTGNISDNTVVNSQTDGSMTTVSVNSDKNVVTETNFVDVDDLTYGERSTEKNPAPSITKRLRSNSGKVVATANEPAKTPKKGKKTSASAKPVHYGPKKQWSKVVQSSEPKNKNLKRKEISSSDSDFDVVQDAIATTGTSARRSMGGRKIPQNIPSVPIDNISFHHEESASRWNCVYNRRLSLKRELGKEALECQEIMHLIKEAGLLKTVWGMRDYYEKLVKEFLDCDDPLSKEF
ncbi:envelope-like protein, partial [Trifolium medium]|nr:envelope-like protein [Trifolium medium]